MAPSARPAAGAAVLGRALRHRNYRLFFFGQGISFIGTWVTRIAMSWLVYRLTNSALLLGVVGFAGQIPTFLLGPFAGVIVDRTDRYRLLVLTQVLSMVQSGLLAFYALIHDRQRTVALPITKIFGGQELGAGTSRTTVERHRSGRTAQRVAAEFANPLYSPRAAPTFAACQTRTLDAGKCLRESLVSRRYSLPVAQLHNRNSLSP